jgi:hypothetical protein
MSWFELKVTKEHMRTSDEIFVSDAAIHKSESVDDELAIWKWEDDGGPPLPLEC